MSGRVEDEDNDLERSEEKLIIRIRSVLCREVEREGNPKGLGRAAVNLPGEVIDILELQDTGEKENIPFYKSKKIYHFF